MRCPRAIAVRHVVVPILSSWSPIRARPARSSTARTASIGWPPERARPLAGLHLASVVVRSLESNAYIHALTPAPSAAARRLPGPPAASRRSRPAGDRRAGAYPTVRPTPPASIYAAPRHGARLERRPSRRIPSARRRRSPLRRPSTLHVRGRPSRQSLFAGPPPNFGGCRLPLIEEESATEHHQAATVRGRWRRSADEYQRPQAEVLGQPTAARPTSRAADGPSSGRAAEHGATSVAAAGRAGLLFSSPTTACASRRGSITSAGRQAMRPRRAGGPLPPRPRPGRAASSPARHHSRYLEVFAMFHRMDANDDRRVASRTSSCGAAPVTWRVSTKAKAKFLEADRAAKGIRFDEFVPWAMASRPRRQTTTTTTRRTTQLATTRSPLRS